VADACDKARRTPLHFASSVGNVDVVVLLLDSGADAAAQDVTGMTPLHLSVSETLPSSYTLRIFTTTVSYWLRVDSQIEVGLIT